MNAKLGKLLVTGIFVAALLVLATWSGYTHWQLSRSASQFESGDYSASEESARNFLRVSPFERHKGHFGIGTALAGDGDLDAGEAELLIALSSSPVGDECAVRINLALVQESQGDAFRDADDIDTANGRYDTARTTLTEAPDECRSSGSNEDEQMTSQEERIGETQEEMNNPSSEGESEGEGEGDGDGDGKGSTDGDDAEGTGDEGQGSGSSGDDGESSQSGSGSDTPGGGESDENSDERMKELEERRRDSEERQSQTNGGGSGSGVREPDAKPW